MIATVEAVRRALRIAAEVQRPELRAKYVRQARELLDAMRVEIARLAEVQP